MDRGSLFAIRTHRHHRGHVFGEELSRHRRRNNTSLKRLWGLD